MELRPIGPDDWKLWRLVRLQALEEAPYAFGSVLVDWRGDGDRESRWRRRLEAVPFNVVAIDEDEPVGQASGTDVDSAEAVELLSMWVAPRARGTGVGVGLIEAVVAWAQGRSARVVTLAVKRDNAHAIALYERAGFVDQGPAADPLERLMTRPLAGC